MSEITEFLQRKYDACGHQGQLVCDRLERLWSDHRRLADPHFLNEFCSGDDAKSIQRYWEMRLGELLRAAGWQLSSSDNGPDFKAAKGEEVVWAEAVAPNVGSGHDRLPDDYLVPPPSGRAWGGWAPTDQIVLRVRTAIDAKHKKLIGYTDADGKYHRGYLDRGIVHAHDRYVIAINTALLGFCGNVGSSLFPSIVEAVFPAGPIEAVLDRETLQVKRQGISHRPVIRKANDAGVSTDLFLQEGYKPVSAILGLHERPDVEWVPSRHVVVVYNPLALNQLADGWCGPADAYCALDLGDHWELKRWSQHHRLGAAAQHDRGGDRGGGQERS